MTPGRGIELVTCVAVRERPHRWGVEPAAAVSEAPARAGADRPSAPEVPPTRQVRLGRGPTGGGRGDDHRLRALSSAASLRGPAWSRRRPNHDRGVGSPGVARHTRPARQAGDDASFPPRSTHDAGARSHRAWSCAGNGASDAETPPPPEGRVPRSAPGRGVERIIGHHHHADGNVHHRSGGDHVWPCTRRGHPAPCTPPIAKYGDRVGPVRVRPTIRTTAAWSNPPQDRVHRAAAVTRRPTRGWVPC